MRGSAEERMDRCQEKIGGDLSHRLNEGKEVEQASADPMTERIEKKKREREKVLMA